MFSILIPELIVLLLAMLFCAHWLSNGLGEMRRPLRQLSHFMLEKAPVGIIDLFSKEKGAGARTWILFGAIWATLASALAFLSIWLRYDAKALDSLTSIGWSYSASAMDTLVEQSLIWGFLGMTLIGASLHINSRVNGGKIGSEANASMVAFAWFILTLTAMFLPLFIEFEGFYFALIEIIYATLVTALLVNHLLTLGGRGSVPLQISSWFIVMAHLSLLWALLVRAAGHIISGDLASEMEMVELIWFADRVVLGWFPLALSLAVLYHVIPKTSKAPIWSRSLSLISFTLLFVSIPVLGMTETEVSGDLMLSVATILTVVGLIPLLAASSNLIATMQGRWERILNTPGATAAASATLLLPILALIGFFSALDELNGAHNMGGVQATIDHGILWTVGGLVALSVWGNLFPEVVGRKIASRSKPRWAFWMLLLGGFGSTVTLLMADFSSITLADAGVEETATHLSGYYLTAAAIFYGVVIATFVSAVNVISTLFSDQAVEDAVAVSSGMTSYNLRPGTTSIRSLISRGVGVDTEIIVSVEEEEEATGITEVGVAVALHTDEGVVMPTAAPIQAAMAEPLSNFEPELVDLARWMSSSGTTAIELFTKMDIDSDGQITAFEVREGLADLDIADLPPWDVEKLVSAMDLDGDGNINIPELEIHMLRVKNAIDAAGDDDGDDVDADDDPADDDDGDDGETAEHEMAADSFNEASLKKLKKAELVSLASERGLSSRGTKADIISRLLG